MANNNGDFGSDPTAVTEDQPSQPSQPSAAVATEEGAPPGTAGGTAGATLEGGPSTANEPLYQPAGGSRNFMELPGWLGGAQGPLGQIMGGMMGYPGNVVPPGAQVQKRHGGFLTGLAGVLIEGLASGMAPTAREAYEMPMRMQQMGVQQQQMQLERMKFQEDMKMQPLREQVEWAHNLLLMQQLRHAYINETAQNQLGLNDTQEAWLASAEKEGRLSVLSSGTYENEMKDWQAQRQKDPDNAPFILPRQTRMDSQGNVQEMSIVRIDPEALTKSAKDIPLSYTDPSGETFHDTIHIAKGIPTKAEAEIITSGTHDFYLAHAGGATITKSEPYGPINPNTGVQDVWDLMYDKKDGHLVAVLGPSAQKGAAGTPPTEATVDLYGQGKMVLSPTAARTPTGITLTNAIVKKYPGFDPEMSEQYVKMRNDYTSGASFKQIIASNAAINHTGQLWNIVSNSNFLKLNLPGTDVNRQISAITPALANEIERATAGGPGAQQAKNDLKDALNSLTVSGRQTKMKSLMNLLFGRLDEMDSAWRTNAPKNVAPPFTVSENSKKVFNRINGFPYGASKQIWNKNDKKWHWTDGRDDIPQKDWKDLGVMSIQPPPPRPGAAE